MLQRSAFIPRQQFHVLINFSDNDEHAVAVLPSEAGSFRVVDQGEIIAEVDFKDSNIICCDGKLEDNVMTQLERQIKSYYASYN